MEAVTRAQPREDRSDRFSIVERVARIVSSVRGTRPDYARLAAELAPAIPFDCFGVVLLRYDHLAARVTVCMREAEGWVAHYHQLPLAESMLAQVLPSPHSSDMVVRTYPDGLDGTPAECGDALSGNPQLRATLIAPLSVGDRVLGTLELGSVDINAYTRESVLRVVHAVAQVLAAAIEGAQFGGNVEIQDRQREELQKVSSALTSNMDLRTILRRIVDGIAAALKVSSAIIMHDRSTGTLRLDAQHGLDAALLQSIVSRKHSLSDRSLIGATLRGRQPIVSNDIAQDERFPASYALSTELGMRSIFSYPLVMNSTVFGALLLLSPEPGGFTPLKTDILSLFASQAMIAIHQGMLLEAMSERRRFQEAIEQFERAQQVMTTPEEELAQVQTICATIEQQYGIRLSSLLRFMSGHLLTRGERDLQSIMHATYGTEEDIPAASIAPQSEGRNGGSPAILQRERDAGSVAALMRTAEAALTRAGLLGDVGAALTAALDIQEPWFIVDLQGQCIYMNPAAEALCGMRLDLETPIPTLSLREALVRLLPRIRNGSEALAYLQEFQRPLLNPLPTNSLRCVVAAEPLSYERGEDSFDSRSMAPDNAPSDHHYQLMRYALYDQQNELIAHALQIHDITGQVRDERNKTALLSSVSHDLRTPLTAIKAAVSGLLQPDVQWDEKTRHEMLLDIDSEADHLHSLINSMVEMSRIEMGALSLEREWSDLIEIMHNSISHVKRVLAGYRVRTEFDTHLPLVFVDYLQLKRVLYNLLENAARHSPIHEEVLVTAHVVAMERPDDVPLDQEGLPRYVRVSVVDHGSGVPEEERERIFKSFYSLDGHTGLGLAICRGIVEAHQGRIWVESAPHGGACFIFIIPIFS